MQVPAPEAALHSLRVECYLDPTLYARVFKKHWFSTPMSWVHRGMLALLLRRADFLLNFGEEEWPASSWVWDEAQLEKIITYFVYKDNPEDELEVPKPLFVWDRAAGTLHMATSRFTVLMLPRGVGKTTIVNLANEIAIVYKDVQFLVYVSETATHAVTQLGNIKREFETNELLMKVFGVLKGGREAGLSWTEDYIECSNGVVVAARGRGGQIRGMNVDAKRPDRIVVDDVEDKESVSTPEQRQKAKVWFFGDLVPALPQMANEGEIIVMGTLLHPEALLQTLVKDPEWASVRFGTLTAELEPIAPFYMDKAKYEAKRQSFARRGMLAEFEMEYNSKVSSEGAAKFNVENIKIQIMIRTEFIAVAEVIDPAISEKEKADFSSIAVTGMTERGQHHVLEIWAKQGASPREQVDEYFNLHFIWNPTHHGVEAIAYQAALVHLLQEEMFRRAKVHGPKAYFEIVDETKRLHGTITKKELRVEGVLQSRYAAGYISHQRYFPQLITQLKDWPYGKMDCPDAVAMAITLLDPFAAMAAADAEDAAGINFFHKNEYEPQVNWRRAP